MKTYVKCSICGISEPADELAHGVCNQCTNGQGTSGLRNINENLSEPVSLRSDRPVKKIIIRDEYGKKIEELVASGKLPKSYKTTVRMALEVIVEPTEDSAILLFERYKSAIPDVPDSLRIEMDKLIIDKLVSEKRLSAVSRDSLLRELEKIKFYHDKISSNLEIEKAVQEATQQAYLAKQASDKAIRDAQDLERSGQVNESYHGSTAGSWVDRQIDKAQAEVEQRRQNSRCPNCKINVSTSAYTCPSCGHPIRFSGTRAGAGCLGWTIIFVAIPALLLFFLMSLG